VSAREILLLVSKPVTKNDLERHNMAVILRYFSEYG